MVVKYGYTIADAADAEFFAEAAFFVENTLGYIKNEDAVEDVDGSLIQTFSKDGFVLKLVSDCQVNYVAILSEKELPLKCLYKFTNE